MTWIKTQDASDLTSKAENRKTKECRLSLAKMAPSRATAKRNQTYRTTVLHKRRNTNPPIHRPKPQNTRCHQTIEDFKPYKADGPTTIPAFILKSAAEEQAPALTNIFQLSLNSGTVSGD